MKAAVLTGGVGGAKLVLGLARMLPAADLTAVVNTGDDFRHLGLHVSPDIDTILYTLAGKANAAPPPAVDIIPHGIDPHRFFPFDELTRADFDSSGRARAKQRVFSDRSLRSVR